MKKIILMICLLFACSIGTIFAQSTQLPAAIGTSDNLANDEFIVKPQLPDATQAQLPGTLTDAGKLTMTVSPNPFKERTVITCTFPATGKLILEVRNMFGKTVKTFEDKVDMAGSQSIEVTSELLMPGIYTAILVFKTGENVMLKTVRIVCTQ